MAMRSVARRFPTLTTEKAELQTPIAELVTAVAPYLLDQPGSVPSPPRKYISPGPTRRRQCGLVHRPCPVAVETQPKPQ